MSPSCFGEPGLNGAPTRSADVVLEARHGLREVAGEARQHVPVDRDAAPLHARQHRDERALERLVDRGHALGGEARFQRPPDAHGRIDALGGVRPRLRRGNKRKGDRVAAGPGDVGERRRTVAEDALPQARRRRGSRRSRPHRARRRSASCRRSARPRRRGGRTSARRTSRSSPILRTPGASSSGFKSAIASSSRIWPSASAPAPKRSSAPVRCPIGT